jgi:hypothetical protein
MKTYQIELKRVSYVNLTIEADSQDEAETLAWRELASDGSYGDSDANWAIESVELEEDEEETGEDLAQFYGPSVRI